MCCTNNSTFTFKVAEISNPLLVTKNLIFPTKEELGKENEARSINRAEVLFFFNVYFYVYLNYVKSVNGLKVCIMSNSYFELTKEKPKLQKLRNLLEMNLFCGRAADQNNDAKKV